MSFFKATWWRPASALIVLALAVAALSAGGRGTALAGVTDGSVTVMPADLMIGEGGSGQVSVVMNPAAAGTSIWIFQIAYDPSVAQVQMSGGNPVCTAFSVPGSFAGAAGCDVKDTNADTVPDTLVVFGGAVMNNNGTPVGLTTQTTVATFTFNAVGTADVHNHTALTFGQTGVTAFLGPNGETPTPATSDGAIDITGGRIWGDVNCDDTFNGGDAINVDRFLVGLPRTGSPPADCPAMDSMVNVNGAMWAFADVNCSGTVSGGDAVNIDRALVGLPVTPAPPSECPVMGVRYPVS